MINPLLKLAPPVNGVVAGQPATCDFTIGPRYHMIDIVIKGTGTGSPVVSLAAMLGLIRLKVNGSTVREIDVSELDALNQLLGSEFAVQTFNLNSAKAYSAALATTDQGEFHVPIYLAEPFRKSYTAAEVAAWPTRFSDGKQIVDLDSFQIELQLKSTSNVTINSVQIYVETDSGIGNLDNGQPVLNISRWQRLTVPYTALGDLPIANIEKKGRLQQANLFSTVNRVSQVRVERDGQIIRECTKQVNDTSLIRRGYASANLSDTRLDLVFDYTDFPVDALNLNGAKQFEIKPTLVGAKATPTVLDTTSQTLIVVTQSFGSGF